MAAIISACCEVMVMSSAYVVMDVFGLSGRGRSEVNILKRRGESMAPCGTPFLSLMFLDSWFKLDTCPERPDRKFTTTSYICSGFYN